jgi:hypothetical protein
MPRVRLIFVITALAAVAAFGVVGASAATLGGLKTNDLGAADGTVASHLGGISVDITPVWDTAGWTVNGLTLVTPGADEFQPAEVVRVSLVAVNGTPLCELSATSPGLQASLAISRASIDTACGGPVAMGSIARVAVVAGS